LINFHSANSLFKLYIIYIYICIYILETYSWFKSPKFQAVYNETPYDLTQCRHPGPSSTTSPYS
jgi:hypothetical protein